MVEHFNEIVTVVAGVATLGASLRWVWLQSIRLNKAMELAETSKDRIENLDQKVITRLDEIREMALEAAKHTDNRFDQVERRIYNLYGQLKTTIPPSD